MSEVLRPAIAAFTAMSGVFLLVYGPVTHRTTTKHPTDFHTLPKQLGRLFHMVNSLRKPALACVSLMAT